MQKPSHGQHPLSCRARGPSARLRQCRWALADVSVCGVPRPLAMRRMLGLNEAKVNIFSWTPPDPGSDKPGYENFSVVAGVSHPKDQNRLKKKIS